MTSFMVQSNLIVNGEYFHQDRVYLSIVRGVQSGQQVPQCSKKEIIDVVMRDIFDVRYNDQPIIKLKSPRIGAGVKSYGNFWGPVMTILGLAVKLKVSNNSEIYVNTKSLSRYVFNLLSSFDQRSGNLLLNEVAAKTHNLYIAEKNGVSLTKGKFIITFDYAKQLIPWWGKKSMKEVIATDGEAVFFEKMHHLALMREEMLSHIENLYKQHGIVDLRFHLRNHGESDL